MLPMYPAYGSSAESEGDGQPPSDSEEDVGTRDAQTYSLNFPGVLR